MPRRKQQPEPEPAPRRRRNTGSISVAADGTIRARLPAKLDPKRTAREFPPDRMAEAVAWLDGQIHPPAALVAVVAPKALGTWTGEWWDSYVAAIRPPNTAATYLSHLAHLRPEYTTPLPDVTTRALQVIVGALNQRVAPATVDAIVSVWRQCLEAAVDDGLIARNPARKLKLPEIPKRAPSRHVTADEVTLLRGAIVGKRFEVAFALMVGCGLRIGEILGLHIEHVDVRKRRAWIQWQFTNGHWRPLPKARNPHWIPLPAWVAVILERHIAQQPAGATLVMQAPHQGKLAKRDGKPRPWSVGTVRSDLRQLIADLGLDPMTPHAGRHGLATYLMDGGIAPPVIAERLGNTPAVVLNTYGHATDGGRERANALTEEYLSGSPVSPQNDDMGDSMGGECAASP